MAESQLQRNPNGDIGGGSARRGEPAEARQQPCSVRTILDCAQLADGISQPCLTCPTADDNERWRDGRKRHLLGTAHCARPLACSNTGSDAVHQGGVDCGDSTATHTGCSSGPISGGRSGLRQLRRECGRMQTAGAVALVTAAALCALLGAGPAAATEINTAVSIFGPWDYELRPDGTSRCTDMVDRSAKLSNSRVLFIATLFWISKLEEGYFESSEVNMNEYFEFQQQVEYYCYNQDFNQIGKGAAGRGLLQHFRGIAAETEEKELPTKENAERHRSRRQICPPATAKDIAYFKKAMGVCFKRAVDAKLSIALSPRLDDGLGLGGWRNGLVFDPYLAFKGTDGDEPLSYYDIMLAPLIEALSGAMESDTKVWFSMQGEMSATVLYYPVEYTRLQRQIKERLLEGHPPEWAPNVKVGIQMNYNKLCACVAEDAIHPNFEHSLSKVIDQFDIPAITRLFDETAFVGMSSYPSLSPHFKPDQLENALWQFAREIKHFGVNLEKLSNEGGIELHWTEYGVGGGTSQNGDSAARTAADAAYYPYFGVFGSYRAAADPWKLQHVQPPPPREYLWYFYNTTAQYLATQVVGKFKYKVDGCFLWSTGSWDIMAVYPESSNTEGSYFDPVVAKIIDSHNSAAREAGHAFIAPTRDKKSSMRKFKSGIGLRLQPVVLTDEGATAGAGNGTGSVSRVVSNSGGASRGTISQAASDHLPGRETSSERVTTQYSSSGSLLTGSHSHVHNRASSSAGLASREKAHDALDAGSEAEAAGEKLRKHRPGSLIVATVEGVDDADGGI